MISPTTKIDPYAQRFPTESKKFPSKLVVINNSPPGCLCAIRKTVRIKLKLIKYSAPLEFRNNLRDKAKDATMASATTSPIGKPDASTERCNKVPAIPTKTPVGIAHKYVSTGLSCNSGDGEVFFNRSLSLSRMRVRPL